MARGPQDRDRRIKHRNNFRRCWSVLFLLFACFLGLVRSFTAQTQIPITFQYVYDDAGQLVKVVDSTGVSLDYIYDAVGNILEVRRSGGGGGGGGNGLNVFSFTPSQGSSSTTVAIQGQGFSPTASADVVRFNGTVTPVQSATANILVVRVPAGATTGPITVTVNGATATSSSPFTITPVPRITSITPPVAAQGTTIPALQVTGENLSGSLFSFLPVFSPSRVTINSVSIGAGGSTATLNLSIAPHTSGSMTLVAANGNGSSDPFPSPANTLAILAFYDPDTDGDGWPDSVERALDSDPNDPLSTPKVSASLAALSRLIALLNTTSLSDVSGVYSGNAASRSISVLNTTNLDVPGSTLFAGQANSAIISILNTTDVTDLASTLYIGQAVSSMVSIANGPQFSPVRISDIVMNVDNHGSQPQLVLRGSQSESKVMEGQTISVELPGKPGGNSEARLIVDGTVFASENSASSTTEFIVPSGKKQLEVRGVVLDTSGSAAAAGSLTLDVTPDPKTTLRGRVIGEDGKPINGAQVVAQLRGLSAEYFKLSGAPSRLPDFETLVASSTGYVSSVMMKNPNHLFGSDPFGTGLAPNYAARLKGFLLIKEDGDYTFALGADEGARLTLAGTPVVQMPAGAGVLQMYSQTVHLSAGVLPIEVDYDAGIGSAEIQLFYAPPGQRLQPVPPELLGVDALDLHASTDDGGNFQIAGVPANVAAVSVRVAGSGITGASGYVRPLPGGITQLGTLILSGNK
jgi:YD repeat-containing protein